MKYNPEIHHRRSIRLKGYDYGQAGLYFITICTWQRGHTLGAIEDGEMQLSQFGEIARDEWFRTAQLRPNITLAEFVVMPNHLHGIISIDDSDGGGDGTGTQQRAPTDDDGTGTLLRAPTAACPHCPNRGIRKAHLEYDSDDRSRL